MCENWHGKKWLKLNVYINHKGNVHGKAVSGDHYFKFFILRSVVLTQFRESVGPCSALYKYNGGRLDNTVLHRQKRLLSVQNEHFMYFLTIKAYWFEE